MIKVSPFPGEMRSYVVSEGEDYEIGDWFELKEYLDKNAPGWKIDVGILTLPKENNITTFFELKYR